MGDEQTHVVTLPDSSEVEFPASMKDEEVSAAVKKIMQQKQENAQPINNGPLPEQPNNPPSSPAGQWLRKTAQSIAGPQSPFGRGAKDISTSLSALGRGDTPTAVMGAVNAASNAPGAALSVLNYIPGAGPEFNEGLSKLAQPGVNLWNAVQPKLRPAANAVFQAITGKDAPILFSPQAHEQANELGQNATGAASATMVGSMAGKVLPTSLDKINSVRNKAADIMSESAYKVPPSIGQKARGSIIETAQKYGINPTKGGIAKLQEVTRNLQNIQGNLENVAREGEPPMVNTKDVLKNLDDLRDQITEGSDTPQDDAKVIDRYRQKVVDQKNPRMSMDDLIALKRNLQDQLSPLYKKAMRVDPVGRERIIQQAKSNVEHAVRSKLEEMIPGYADVNSELHNVIDLKKFVDRATNRISNRELFTLADETAAAGGYLVGGAKGGALAAIANRVLRIPAVASAIANKLSTAAPPSFYPKGIARPSATATPESAYGVSIPDESKVPHPGPVWTKHPSGFEVRELPEEK